MQGSKHFYPQAISLALETRPCCTPRGLFTEEIPEEISISGVNKDNVLM